METSWSAGALIQVMFTRRYGMLDSQMLTEVKYMALYGLSFSPRFCFVKRTHIYYIHKEAGLKVSQYVFCHPCNHLLHSHSLDFYQETKTKTGLPTYFWARKVDIPNNNFGWWWGGRRKKFGDFPIGFLFSQSNPN